jgi:hypothetical protein
MRDERRRDRRTFLGWGATAVAGLLAGALGAREARGQPVPSEPRPARRCILLWMNGGPSHVDTFDPKPGTSAAGPLRAIPSRASGVRLSELLPEVAEVADRLTIVRGMTSREGNHQRARYLVHTGYAENPTVDHPSLGGWVSHELGGRGGELPAHVCIDGPGVGAGFLGAAHGPFVVQRAGELPTSALAPEWVAAPRFERRTAALDLLEADFARRAGRDVEERRQVYARSLAMMRSPELDAFDIGAEPARVVDAYGDSEFGRACLTARRLVEAGVPFVEVVLDGWDTHRDNFGRTAELCRQLDPAMAALVRDLGVRGLLDDTLVLWMGEFGRSPDVNGEDGRDHHPAAWSAVLAGGGARPGMVRGETDARGERVVAGAVTVPDLLATVLHLLGVRHDAVFQSRTGRPISVTDGGVPIEALMA